MDVLVDVFMVALIIAGIGSGFAYILGLKDDIKWSSRENEKLEHNVDWWQKYCDKIVEEHKETLNEHEERLSKLQSKIKDLEKEIDAKNDEILLLEKEILEFKTENGTINVETRVIENLREIRAATKDLDFPPTDKISDTINKFLIRESKKESSNDNDR